MNNLQLVEWIIEEDYAAALDDNNELDTQMLDLCQWEDFQLAVQAMLE